MKYYKIEPHWKKSIYEYTGFANEDKTIKFETEEMYRWGHIVIQLEEGETLEDRIGDYEDDNNVAEFSFDESHDTDLDDQCSFYFNNVVGIDEEVLSEKFDEEGYDYLREGDYIETYSYLEFVGKLKVTDVTDQYSK